ncbi:MAG: glycosyltransferase family 39 protein [Flavobacteriaceae bacterium]|nr:glycosyltransferase family 39 protein [Flavobacteriaceae bacterium]
MKKILSNKFAISVLIIVVIRAFLNAIIPLMDKTEARYAEIARIMQETGDWITPHIDYTIPFWAKPPLSTWLSASSFELFGLSEFTARLPYLLLSIALLLLIGKYGKRNGTSFFLPGFILLCIPEFLIHAGVVSTDTALAFCVALVLISFWETMSKNGDYYWKYLLFVGLGLGLLAKGPIVFILTLPPMFIWTVYFGQFKLLFKKTPWFLGTLIVVIIAFPWYYLAEKNSPGFFDYFIVGEHFKRFFDASWQGDLYGFPKTQPRGIIWLFLAVFSLPWIQLVVVKLWKNRSEAKQNKWVVFLMLWLLWTPLFFSVSSSLIHPYIMPVMVPIALLITHYWKDIKRKKIWIRVGLILPVLTLIMGVLSLFGSEITYYGNTDKQLIQHHPSIKSFYHLGTKSYSTQFYTKGKVKSLEISDLITLSPNHKTGLIIRKKLLRKIDTSTLKHWKIADSTHKKVLYIYQKKEE